MERGNKKRIRKFSKTLAILFFSIGHKQQRILKEHPYFIENRSIISVTKDEDGQEQMNKRTVHNYTSTLPAPSRELLHQGRT